MIELTQEERDLIEGIQEVPKSDLSDEQSDVLEKIKSHDGGLNVEALTIDESPISGFYGVERRRAGDKFRIVDGRAFSYRWMKLLPADVPLSIGPKDKRGRERAGTDGSTMIDRDNLYNRVEAEERRRRDEENKRTIDIEKKQSDAGYTPPAEKTKGRKVL